LPFIATENILMEAVKRGGDRQKLHEIIRQCSMKATAKMKAGEPWDLLSDLAAEPELKLSADDIKGIMDPKLYIGRCPSQVTALIEKIKPILVGSVDAAEINL
ncbi:MAG: adenylosuccinate lyase, partial [Lachnospiraceae bacterium]|nr:adenylosuccinate lyase [Lachnospiraceae bacterium]